MNDEGIKNIEKPVAETARKIDDLKLSGHPK